MIFENYLDCQKYLDKLKIENPDIVYCKYCFFDFNSNMPVWAITQINNGN